MSWTEQDQAEVEALAMDVLSGGRSQGAGVKHDTGKRRWTLLPWRELGEVVDVLGFGAQKYPSPNNWQSVENARERYSDAALRHVQAWLGGERRDPETGKSHLAHAVCCLLFLMWFDAQG